MDGDKPAKKRFWRWRTNPLRRHDDIVEAWLVLDWPCGRSLWWAALSPVW
ncbi:hypothetical protein ACFYR1_50145 [Streptomyces canus]